MSYRDIVKGGESMVGSLVGRIVPTVVVAAAMAVGDIRAQADGTVIACTSERSGDVEIAGISYRSDGLRIAGYVLRPVGVNRKLPAVIYNRGGNRHFGAVGDRTLAFLKGFARSGYVVLASQYRGGPGSEGRDRFGGDDVNDVLNLVKVAASIEQIDHRRLFMYGHSRGGIMTYRALKGRADVRAAVVAAGVSDLRLIMRNRPGMRRLVDRLVGLDDRLLSERSAIDWAEDLDVPILLLHGDADRRVSIDHSRRMAEELKSLGKPVRLRVFWGENHGFTGSRNEVRRLSIGWFEQHDRAPRDGAPFRPRESICTGLTGSGPVTADTIAQAVISGNAEKLGRLIARGADPDAPVSFNHPRFAGGRTIVRPPLVVAALYGSAAVTRRLLESGAGLSGPARGAICPAVFFGHREIVALLIGAGLEVRGYRGCGRRGNVSPLAIARHRGHHEIAELLSAADDGAPTVESGKVSVTIDF